MLGKSGKKGGPFLCCLSPRKREALISHPPSFRLTAVVAPFPQASPVQDCSCLIALEKPVLLVPTSSQWRYRTAEKLVQVKKKRERRYSGKINQEVKFPFYTVAPPKKKFSGFVTRAAGLIIGIKLPGSRNKTTAQKPRRNRGRRSQRRRGGWLFCWQVGGAQFS